MGRRLSTGLDVFWGFICFLKQVSCLASTSMSAEDIATNGIRIAASLDEAQILLRQTNEALALDLRFLAS